MMAPVPEELPLQRPLLDDVQRIAARTAKEDAAADISAEMMPALL